MEWYKVYGLTHSQLYRTVLDFVIMQLQQKTAHSNKAFESWGESTMYTTRPWALVFVHDPKSLTQAIKDDISFDNRPWLESIRVCQVENIHQLRAILCAMHIHMEQTLSSTNQSDLLSWMQTERDNQPPCLIVVKDLLRWMAETTDRGLV
ncbi:hypothetical protein BDA99DRAFT_437828 [Phascolomyces articulosus]|uniref:Uncharacterized protein n=1 Tax=Phascolomyces articulosus TaxID=60185 RepID=A0AAD5KB22_9FUNG|nr:hypothetical protein BDA99DRAFT_437828 [Phascolomyces articulosus]